MITRRVAAPVALLALVPSRRSCREGRGPTASARPNVVVILTDDQDPASVKVMKAVQRELAAKGVTFANNYATTPECCPSRVSFQTGQYKRHRRSYVATLQGRLPGFRRQPKLIRNEVGVRCTGPGTARPTGRWPTGYGIAIYGGVRTPRARRNVPQARIAGTSQSSAPEYRMYDSDERKRGCRSMGAAPSTCQADVYARQEAQAFVHSSGTGRSSRRPNGGAVGAKGEGRRRVSGDADWPRGEARGGDWSYRSCSS